MRAFGEWGGNVGTGLGAKQRILMMIPRFNASSIGLISTFPSTFQPMSLSLNSIRAVIYVYRGIFRGYIYIIYNTCIGAYISVCVYIYIYTYGSIIGFISGHTSSLDCSSQNAAGGSSVK